MSAVYDYVGSLGTGSFTQSGGTDNLYYLDVGANSASSGTYNLLGSGQLSASAEYVGYAAGTATAFQQSGGTNATALLTIGSGGSYSLAGGLLQVNGNLLNQGVFSGGAAPAVLSGSGILDLSAGTLQNAGNISVSIAANSLLIVPPGFSPATGFAAYSSLGLTHTLGTTLAVPAGQGFGGSGSINDLVACQGTIAATGVAINLNNGLVLSGTGQVLLGSGIITNNDLVSGISGGGLSAVYQYVGSGGTGSFTQSGGTSAIRDYLYLGYGAGDSGVYALSGGQLSAGDQYIGYSAREAPRNRVGRTA